MANRTAVIQTNKGTIRVELLESDAPKTTENFITLAERGYYDGIIFHRVIKGFMIQGGDPTGTGRGGESAWGGRFNDEIDPKSEVYQRGYKAGTLAMANAGPNTNGSQFFIMHVDYPLPPSYTIFGRVTEGQDVVNAIATSPDGSQRSAGVGSEDGEGHDRVNPRIWIYELVLHRDRCEMRMLGSHRSHIFWRRRLRLRESSLCRDRRRSRLTECSRSRVLHRHRYTPHETQ